MPANVKGNPRLIKCLVEHAIENMGFILVRDGYRRKVGDQAANPTFYTKIYRGNINGKPINTWIKFTYDLRSGFADISTSYKDLAVMEQEMLKAESIPHTVDELEETLQEDVTLPKKRGEAVHW